MKTIRPGQTPATPIPPWWIGTKVSCPVCRGVFELEATDTVSTNVERHPGGKQWVEVTCPTEGCREVIKGTRLDR